MGGWSENTKVSAQKDDLYNKSSNAWNWTGDRTAKDTTTAGAAGAAVDREKKRWR